MNCPLCNKWFSHKAECVKHVQSRHPEALLAEDLTAEQLIYRSTHGTIHGKCMCGCGRDTEWNYKTGKPYKVSPNPECKKRVAAIADARNKRKYGREKVIDDPQLQAKMLANRKISGKYKFKDGGEVGYTGKLELNFLQFCDNILELESRSFIDIPEVFYYRDDKEDKERFYMADYYLPDYNLIIEIKPGGDNPNMNPAYIEETRYKEDLKDAAMLKQTKYNYLKIVDKQYGPLVEVLFAITHGGKLDITSWNGSVAKILKETPTGKYKSIIYESHTNLYMLVARNITTNNIKMVAISESNILSKLYGGVREYMAEMYIDDPIFENTNISIYRYVGDSDIIQGVLDEAISLSMVANTDGGAINPYKAIDILNNAGVTYNIDESISNTALPINEFVKVGEIKGCDEMSYNSYLTENVFKFKGKNIQRLEESLNYIPSIGNMGNTFGSDEAGSNIGPIGDHSENDDSLFSDDSGSVTNSRDVELFNNNTDDELDDGEENEKASLFTVDEASIQDELKVQATWLSGTKDKGKKKATIKVTNLEYKELQKLVKRMRSVEDYKTYRKLFGEFARKFKIPERGTIICDHMSHKTMFGGYSVTITYSNNTKKYTLPEGYSLYHVSTVDGIKELQPQFRGKSVTGYMYDKPRIYFSIRKNIPKVAADLQDKKDDELYKYKAKEDIREVYIDPLAWAPFIGAVYVETDKPISVEQIDYKTSEPDKSDNSDAKNESIGTVSISEFIDIYNLKVVDESSQEYEPGDNLIIDENILNIIGAKIKNFKDYNELKTFWNTKNKLFRSNVWDTRTIDNENEYNQLQSAYKNMSRTDESYLTYKRCFNKFCKLFSLLPETTIIENIRFYKDKSGKNTVAMKFSSGVVKVELPDDVQLTHVSPAEGIKELIPSYKSKTQGKYFYQSPRVFFTIKKVIDANKAGLEKIKVYPYTPKEKIKYAYIDPTYTQFSVGSVFVPTTDPIPVEPIKRKNVTSWLGGDK